MSAAILENNDADNKEPTITKRKEFELTDEMTWARQVVSDMCPGAESQFFWSMNSPEDGFNVVCNGEVIGSARYYGYEWLDAMRRLQESTKVT